MEKAIVMKIENELWKAAKVAAAKNGQHLRVFVAQAIREKLERNIVEKKSTAKEAR